MAGVDFTCGVCERQSGRDVFGSAGQKWKCPKHRDVCHRCVSGGILSDKKCKKCGSVVMAYQFSKSYNKWLKVD